MKQRKIIALALAAMLLLAGCGSSAKMEAARPMEPSAPAPAPEASFDYAESESITMAPMEKPMMPETGGSVYQRADAKLIRRCTMEMQTTEFDGAFEALYGLVGKYGGYFESSSVRGGSYYNADARRSADYVIRIPAQQYDAFRASVGELGHVTYSTESTEDIGEQYYDTEARLKTLRTKQERLLSLLEKAETMEDIISLESALSDVEYEIERNSSTLNRYDGLVNYATFTVMVYEVTRVDDSAGQADSLMDRMRSGFTSGLEDLIDGTKDLLVWFSYNFFSLLFLIVIGGGAILFVRRKVRLPRWKGKKREETLPKD